MMAICGMSDTLDAAFGEGWHHGGKLDIRLVNVVWVNDVLTTKGLQAGLANVDYRGVTAEEVIA